MPPQAAKTPGLQPPALPPTDPEKQSNKFVPDSDWTLITESKTVMGDNGELPVLTGIEDELGALDVHDILGDYLNENAMAVQHLLLSDLGLTGGESTKAMDATEAMDVDPSPVLPTKVQDQPMETEHQGTSLGTFRPELTGPGYTPSLISSMGTPLSPITAVDNTLLDAADPETPGVDVSKAPGAGRPEGLPNKGSPAGSGMTLQKRKPPPT